MFSYCNFNDLKLPINFATTSSIKTEITATDKSLPSGNTISKFICLNLRVRNITPDALLVRTQSEIVVDSGVSIVEPDIITANPNLQKPTDFVCNEIATFPAMLTPLDPVLINPPVPGTNTVT